MIRILVISIAAQLLWTTHAFSQYWQQRVAYEMEVSLDDQNHQYKGTQKVTYWNNSPDTLYRVYFHLFPNAFQPGSMMDIRSQEIVDPDPRVGDRIGMLSPEDQGFLHVTQMTQKKKVLQIKESGTILEVELDQPIRPGKKTVFTMEFHGQVPVQIRRSGRDNREGVAYSMAQWYPKMCEFDRMGWHAYPYVGREFHGVWGSFDVKLTLDSAYTVAATGILKNAKSIGKGYLPEGQEARRPDGDQLTWHFFADKVHDFAWGADKDYLHITHRVDDDLLLRFFFKNQPDLIKNWEKLPEQTARAFVFANGQFGRYPYPEYNVVQGGDGGMEYPMLTFITGQRRYSSLVGVTVHEAIHSWYQLMLGSNEALYPWMDEGFTTYAGSLTMSHLFNPEEDTRRGRYFDGYIALATSGMEEPMSKHADHYNTNYAYGAASYNKGGTFVGMLGYVMGDDLLKRGLKRYYEEWRFKHPDPHDFIRVMEKTSGMHLDWYLNYMMNTTETIDYALEAVEESGDAAVVSLRRVGNFPMPIDLDLTLKDGTKQRVHIPLRIMRKAKAAEDEVPYRVAEAWPWTHPTYEVVLEVPKNQLLRVEIDASLRLADVDRSNNVIDFTTPSASDKPQEKD